jgi:Mg2+/Co2+ transporter CorB
MVDRSFDPFSEILKVNQQFDLELPTEYGDTLVEMMEEVLKKRPVANDSIRIKNLEIVFKEGDFMGDSRVHIRTIIP